MDLIVLARTYRHVSDRAAAEKGGAAEMHGVYERGSRAGAGNTSLTLNKITSSFINKELSLDRLCYVGKCKICYINSRTSFHACIYDGVMINWGHARAR